MFESEILMDQSELVASQEPSLEFIKRWLRIGTPTDLSMGCFLFESGRTNVSKGWMDQLPIRNHFHFFPLLADFSRVKWHGKFAFMHGITRVNPCTCETFHLYLVHSLSPFCTSSRCILVHFRFLPKTRSTFTWSGSRWRCILDTNYL